MRLYLSSYKFGNKPEELIRLVGDKNKRVALIPNAVDYSDDQERRQESLKKDLEILSGLGFIPEEVDLRKYFNKEQELKAAMSQFGMVWVRGGNTFLLRRAFKQSGFDKVIKSLLEEDEIVYAGYSAGVCILAPSFRGLELVDNPEVIAAGYDKEVIWEGLNVLNYIIAPHYKSDHPESAAIERVVSYLDENHLPYQTLRDGEVILIEGNKETLIT